MKSQISVVEPNQQTRPICPNSTILLSNAVENSQSVTLEQHILQPFEQPEVRAMGHLLSIHLGKSINLEHRSESPWKSDHINYGDFCLTPDNTSFAARWQETTESILLQLQDSWFQSAVTNLSPSSSVDLQLQRGKQDSLLSSLVITLRNETAHNYPSGRLYYDSLLQTLAIHLACQYGTKQPKPKPPKGLSRRQLNTAIAFMEANFNRNLKLVEIARVVGLSEYYFERQFKKSLGITPHQYLTQFKINRAQQLLKQPNYSIVRISQKCGFSSPSYFAKLFRQIVGVTPRQYRIYPQIRSIGYFF